MLISKENPFLLRTMREGQVGRIGMTNEGLGLILCMSSSSLRLWVYIMSMAIEAPRDVLLLERRTYNYWLEDNGFPEIAAPGFRRARGRLIEYGVIMAAEKRFTYFLNVGLFYETSKLVGLNRKIGAIMKINAREVMDADKRARPDVVVIDRETGEVMNGEEDWD